MSCSREASFALHHCKALCSFWVAVFPSQLCRKVFRRQSQILQSRCRKSSKNTLTGELLFFGLAPKRPPNKPSCPETKHPLSSNLP